MTLEKKSGRFSLWKGIGRAGIYLAISGCLATLEQTPNASLYFSQREGTIPFTTAIRVECNPVESTRRSELEITRGDDYHRINTREDSSLTMVATFNMSGTYGVIGRCFNIHGIPGEVAVDTIQAHGN
ncbi:MAG: hypothetical protein ABIH49_01575 [archaeon]